MSFWGAPLEGYSGINRGAGVTTVSAKSMVLAWSSVLAYGKRFPDDVKRFPEDVKRFPEDMKSLPELVIIAGLSNIYGKTFSRRRETFSRRRETFSRRPETFPRRLALEPKP